MTTMGVEIAIMTGVIIDTTDAMMTDTIDGITDEVAIIIETLIGITTHAATTDSASSLGPV